MLTEMVTSLPATLMTCFSGSVYTTDVNWFLHPFSRGRIGEFDAALESDVVNTNGGLPRFLMDWATDIVG